MNVSRTGIIASAAPSDTKRFFETSVTLIAERPMQMGLSHFMPHGMCFLWETNLLAFHVVADALIALAYFSIPIFLIWLLKKRGDLPFSWILGMFALFIVSCGVTHLVAIWVIWHPDYWVEGAIKWVTAVASIGTALMLVPLTPKLLAIRSPEQAQSMFTQLQRERSVATSFQNASLSRLPQDPHGLEINAIYRPAESDLEIGGDWYDAFPLLDGRLLVSIGDVTGKGLEAAVVMSKVRQAIRVAGQIQLDPAAILTIADRALRSEYPDTIVTAFVGIFDRVEQRFVFANAGHPQPLVRYADGRVEALNDEPSLPLGLRLPEESALLHSRKLEVDSLFVLYTDGLTEVTHDIDAGELLLREAVLSEETFTARNPAESIHGLVVGDSARDDVAVITIRITTLELERDSCHWRFDARDHVAAVKARDEFRDFLGLRVSAEHLFNAELIYGELIANVVRYTPGPVEIRVDWNRGNPTLHVFDTGPGFQFLPRLPRDMYSECGRGIYLVSALAEDFHVSRRPSKGSHARVVLHSTATILRARGGGVRQLSAVSH